MMVYHRLKSSFILGKTVTKTEEEEMQSSGDFEHIQANNDGKWR